MLTPAIQLREKLAGGERVMGIMATDLLSPVLIEVAAQAGIDYVVVDREHGAFSDEAVAEFCRVGRLADFAVLVRTISCEPSVVRRTIDLGPCGILLPNVESTDQLDSVANTIQMPPEGSRRPGGPGNYWMGNFHRESWRENLEAHFIVIPQIESLAGVETAPELAAHPVVTALGVGPYDLSADLGCCWHPENEDFQDALRQIRVAADAVDKKVWIGTDVGKYASEGYTFLWCGTFASVLSGALTQVVAGSRVEEGGSPPPA